MGVAICCCFTPTVPTHSYLSADDIEGAVWQIVLSKELCGELLIIVKLVNVDLVHAIATDGYGDDC